MTSGTSCTKLRLVLTFCQELGCHSPHDVAMHSSKRDHLSCKSANRANQINHHANGSSNVWVDVDKIPKLEQMSCGEVINNHQTHQTDKDDGENCNSVAFLVPTKFFMLATLLLHLNIIVHRGVLLSPFVALQIFICHVDDFAIDAIEFNLGGHSFHSFIAQNRNCNELVPK